MNDKPPTGPEPGQQPYGQAPYQPYGQPQYGQQPYGGAYPPSPYPPPPGRSGKSTLFIVLAVLLTCGLGIAVPVAGVVWLAKEVDSTYNTDYVGSKNDPITVTPGEAFSIRDLNYAEGWRLDPNALEYDQAAISGLEVKSARDEAETYLNITFEFAQDDTILADVDCRAPATVRKNSTTAMECNNLDTSISGYTEIRVYDNSSWE